MKHERMILKQTYPASFKDGKWTYKVETKEVIVMCVDGKWAMVRLPRCVPFVVESKDLSVRVNP